jgi:hypothetical protein
MLNPYLISLGSLSQHLPQQSACDERFVPILHATPPSVVIAREAVWKAGPHPQSKSGKGALPPSELHAGFALTATRVATAAAGESWLRHSAGRYSRANLGRAATSLATR